MADEPVTLKQGRVPFHVDLRALPWTSLRTIGNSSTVRMTIFIPLIGYLVLFNGASCWLPESFSLHIWVFRHASAGWRGTAPVEALVYLLRALLSGNCVGDLSDILPTRDQRLRNSR